MTKLGEADMPKAKPPGPTDQVVNEKFLKEIKSDIKRTHRLKETTVDC